MKLFKRKLKSRFDTEQLDDEELISLACNKWIGQETSIMCYGEVEYGILTSFNRIEGKKGYRRIYFNTSNKDAKVCMFNESQLIGWIK